MSKHWAKLRALIKSGSFFQHGHSPYNYSARASFQYSDFKQGVVLDIDRRKTLSGIYLDDRGAIAFLLSLTALHVGCGYLLLNEPKTDAEKTACASLALLTLFLYFVFIAVSNRQLLFRILCRSSIAYVKLYMCIIETFALVSMLNWKFRALCVAPLLLSSQFTVFTSDSVFYHFQKKTYTITLIVIFLAFRIYLLVSVRYHTIDTTQTYFTIASINFFNTGTFFSKSLSLSLFLVAQLIFHMRHPRQLFAIRTCYTVMQNREWFLYDREKRVKRKETLTDCVRSTHDHIMAKQYTELIV